MNNKTRIFDRLKWVGLVTITALPAVFVLTALGQSAPGLTIGQTATNEFTVQITNGSISGRYELYYSPIVGDAAYPFNLLVIGSLGQTNFVIDGGPIQTAFFFVGVGNDWDGDGVENYRDANPQSTNIGQLAITIDVPANNAVIQ